MLAHLEKLLSSHVLVQVAFVHLERQFDCLLSGESFRFFDKLISAQLLIEHRNHRRLLFVFGIDRYFAVSLDLIVVCELAITIM